MKPVTLYVKSYCPFCTAAEALLKKKGVEYECIEITGDRVLRDQMLARSNGRSTVPQIFIGDQHVGGFDDLNALDKSGRLDPLLSS